MKNNSFKILSLLGLIAIIYFLTNDIGYCAASAAQTAQTTANTAASTASPMHNAIVKFLYAMGGVVISSLLIFGGLTIYNKFFVKNPRYRSPEEDILKTPKTVDDAVVFFLKKNRLK